MSVTKVVFTYFEGDAETGEREMTLSRVKEEIDLLDLMYFFAEAARAAGYPYVEQVGCTKTEGGQTWSEF
jgi:hypothetical protein